MKIKIVLAIAILFVIGNISCFAQTNKIIEKSKTLYTNIDSYTADFVIKLHDQGQNPMIGKICYKSPNLLKMEATHSRYGKERKIITVLDGKDYFSEVTTISPGSHTIHNAGGVAGHVVQLKEGDPLYSVMIYRETLKETIQERLGCSINMLEAEELAFVLTMFHPGPYFKKAIFPFALFEKYYLITSVDNATIMATLKTPSPKLPEKVKIYFDSTGFISKIEIFDSQHNLKAEVEYKNINPNVDLQKEYFKYKIPSTALVADIESDLKNN